MEYVASGCIRICDIYYKTCEQWNKATLRQSCDDKSDKIFTVNSSCRTEEYGEIFRDHICSATYINKPAQYLYQLDDQKICANIAKWINEKTTKDYLDPHDCQSSCRTPEYRCEACTHKDYSFQCVRDGTKVCIHKDLVCDGHPVCDLAEDEDLTLCRKEYFIKKLVEQYATKECQSMMYSDHPNMKTIATMCNEVRECHDGSDEACEDSTLSKLLLGTASIGVFFLYLGLKLGRVVFKKYWHKLMSPPSFLKINREDIFQELRTDHNDFQKKEDLNNYLLHIINSRELQETKEMCKQYYALEADVHKTDQSAIFRCLHQRLHPSVITEVIEAETPGLRSRFYDWIERKLKTKAITAVRNKIIQKPRLGQLISTLLTIIKIEMTTLDIVKDLFLAAWIIYLVGGPEAVWKFSTNFSSVVGILALGTVIAPLALSSLHLMIEDPWAILPFETQLSRPLAILITFLLMPINSILLINSYQSAKEEARLAAKESRKNLFQKFEKHRKIKKRFVEHLHIELGRASDWIVIMIL